MLMIEIRPNDLYLSAMIEIGFNNIRNCTTVIIERRKKKSRWNCMALAAETVKIENNTVLNKNHIHKSLTHVFAL
jgi:hypothetical protein